MMPLRKQTTKRAHRGNNRSFKRYEKEPETHKSAKKSFLMIDGQKIFFDDSTIEGLIDRKKNQNTPIKVKTCR